MVKSKFMMKFFSLCLSVLVIYGVVSSATPVFAAEVDATETLKNSIELLKTEKEDNSIFTEILEERTEFTKLYQKQDNSYVAIVSSTPIHYKADDEWLDIDNTLVEKTIDKKNVFVNKCNSFEVTFPKEFNSDEVVVGENGKSVSFRLEFSARKNNSKGVVEVKSRKAANNNDNELVNFDNKTQKITYNEVTDNTNIEYIVTQTGIKENIVLEKKPSKTITYTYIITTDGLEAELKPDKSVRFFDDTGDVYIIPAPIMYDKNGKVSMNIAVGLSGESGRYSLSYTPSFSWLNNDAEYPVTIDPVLSTAQSESGIIDTTVIQSDPSVNYGNSAYGFISNSENENATMLFNLNEAYLLSVMGLAVKNISFSICGSSLSENSEVSAYKILGTWDEDTVTYNTCPQIDTTAIDKKAIYGISDYCWTTFDVTEVFCNGQSNGFALKISDSQAKTVLAYTSELNSQEYSPYAKIEYYDNVGICDYYDYHMQSAGRAGDVYINDFTNQLYIERDELGISFGEMPVNIKRYYNSSYGKFDLYHYLLELNGFYGFNWSINYAQNIMYYPNQLDEEERILYRNDSGQIKYFKKTDTINNGICEWEEVSYNGYPTDELKINVPTEIENNISNNLDKIILINSKGQKYEFNSLGNLVKINSSEEDSNASITISYVEDHLISKIKDGVGREYCFTYNDNYLLTSIQVFDSENNAIKVKNDSGEDVDLKYVYAYTSDDYKNNLTEVTYPDGKKVNYNYDSDSVVIKNIDGYALEYNKSGNITVSLCEKVYNINGEVIATGDSLTITKVNTYEKIFTDSYGTTLTKQFDLLGRTTAVLEGGNVDVKTFSYGECSYHTLTGALYNLNICPTNENRTNLLVNSSFSTGISNWNKSSNSISHSPSENYSSSATEKGAIKLEASSSSLLNVLQKISVNDGEKGDEYTLSAWTKAVQVPPTSIDNTSLFGILVEARMNNNGNETWETVCIAECNPLNTNWNIVDYSFTIDFDYNEINVIPYLFVNLGYVLFDEVCLYNTYKNDGNTSEDDTDDTNNGNTSEETSGKCTCKNCSEPNCPCRNCSDECDLPYCNRGISYDSNSTDFTVTMTDGQYEMIMQSSATAQTGFDGVTQTIVYDFGNGQLKSVANGNGIISDYTYNAMSMVTAVTEGVSGLSNGTSMQTKYLYENDRITSISHNDFSYNFEYDVWGRVSNVKIASIPLASYEYSTTKEKPLNKLTYGNGDYISYSYDNNGNINSTTKRNENGDVLSSFSYAYDTSGELISTTDTLNDTKVEYFDDGVVIKALGDTADNDTVLYSLSYSNYLDEKNYEEKREVIDSQTFVYSKNSSSYDIQTGNTTSSHAISSDFGNLNFENVSDYFGRTVSDYYSTPIEVDEDFDVNMKRVVDYTYKTNNNKTTTLVDGYKETLLLYGVSTEDSNAEEIEEIIDIIEYAYDYDSDGNITRISLKEEEDGFVETETLVSYVYDEAGQLIRENNAFLDKTIVLSYDKGGNINSRTEYEYTESEALGEPLESSDIFTYDSVWKDKLIKYNNNQINYDEIGNPLNGVVSNISGDLMEQTYTWEGRQLKTITTADAVFEHCYDSDGYLSERIQYDSDGEKTAVYRYFWNDEKLSGYAIYGENNICAYIIKILYDSNDSPIGFSYKSNDEEQAGLCLYRKNLQNDIVAVCKPTGETIVEYAYDAWGRPTASCPGSSLSEIISAAFMTIFNPLTYRGYFYDVQSGLYYMHSRFYNPSYGRFINMDAIDVFSETTIDIMQANLFAYCNNNPVMNVDFSGRAVAAAATAVAIAEGLLELLFIVALVLSIFYALKLIVDTAPPPDFYNPFQKLKGILLLIGVEVMNLTLTATYNLAMLSEKTTKQIDRHHIVAKAALRAAPARLIFSFVNLGVNDDFNLVPLKKVFHMYLHTTLYYEFVNLLVCTAYNCSTEGDRQQRVINMVIKIGEALTQLNDWVII